MTWKKFLTASKVLTTLIILLSCSPLPNEEELRVELFYPGLSIPANYSPFFFSLASEYYFYDKYARLPEDNLQSWQEYFNYLPTQKQIADVIYYISPANFDTNTIKNMADTNIFAKEILYKKNNEIFFYLKFTKKVENFYDTYDYNPWQEHTQHKTQAFNQQLLQHIALMLAEKSKNDFLKHRYAYQAIVINRYREEYQKTIDIYHKYFEDSETTDIIKYWALFHVAFAEKQLGEKQKACQDYLDVLYNSSGKTSRVIRALSRFTLEKYRADFTPEQNFAADFYNALKNPKYALKEISEIDKKFINHQLYKLLINRELNKLSHREYSIDEQGKRQMTSNEIIYAKKLANYLNKIIPLSNNENKNYFKLALAQAYVFAQNSEKSLSTLNSINVQQLTGTEKFQYNITKSLAIALKSKTYNSTQANQLAECLWVAEQYKDSAVFANQTYKSLYSTLFTIFDSKKMYLTAALMLTKGTRIGTYYPYRKAFFYFDKKTLIAETQRYLDLTLDTNKQNKLEKFVLSDEYVSKNDYYDLLGTFELRKGNLQNALFFYDKVDKDYWRELSITAKIKGFVDDDYIIPTKYPSPFIYYDMPKNKYVYKKTNSKYCDKSIFVRELQYLIKKYNNASGNKKGLYALKIANAYYNISYFGEYWFYVSYGWSTSGCDWYSSAFNTMVNENYRTCSTALKYYEKATQYLTDKNIKADVYFIEANIYKTVKTYLPVGCKDITYWNYNYNNIDYTDNPYLDKLKKFSPEKYKYYQSICEF